MQTIKQRKKRAITFFKRIYKIGVCVSIMQTQSIPNYLFGSSTASVSSEKGFYMRMFDGQIRVENNLFLWHFEAKIQKSASEHRYIDEGKFSNINQLAKAVGLDSSFVAANLRLRWLAPKVVHELIQGGIGNVSLKQLRHGVPVLWSDQEKALMGE